MSATPSDPTPSGERPPEALARRLDRACNQFEAAWRAGGALPRLEDFLIGWEGQERLALLRELAPLDAHYRRRAGEECRAEDYLGRFPELGTDWQPETFGPAPPPPSPPGAGQSLGGYELLRELGQGGMGAVYEARQKGLGRLVALKVILAGAQAGAEQRARFRAEAEAVARLQHPNIVQVYEVGEEDGRPYFSMELVEGGALDRKIAGAPQPAGPTAELVEVLARAAHYAHTRGVVHRDLKPANVLLAGPIGNATEGVPYSAVGNALRGVPGADAVPKITDFGLAKRLDLGPGQTRSGAVLGTPSYMAPEQAEGRPEAVGPLADVYALGAILYECLTGRPPFKGPSVMDTLLQVVADEPVPPARLNPKVPRDLETICLKCLEKQPNRRYASALDLAEDLRRFRSGEPIVARPVSLLGRGLKWARRRPAVAALAGLVVAVTALGLGLVTWKWLEAVDERAQAVAARGEAQQKAADEERARGRAERASAERAQALKEEKRAHKKAETALRERGVALGRSLDSLYRHRVNLAYHEWLAGSAGRAEELLNGCPLDRRHWEYHYLKRQSDTSLLTYPGHQPLTVHCVAFSPDGKRVASADQKGAVHLWDAATGEAVVPGGWKAHPVSVFSTAGFVKPVLDVAFTPDGNQVISTGRDGNVRFWSASTGKRGPAFRPQGGITAVAFSADRKRLATAGQDMCVRLWDGATRKLVQTFSGPTAGITCLAFSPDGGRLAAGCKRGKGRFAAVWLWDTASGKKEAPLLQAHSGDVAAVAFNQGGRQLLSTAVDRTAHHWDLQTGQALRRETYRFLVTALVSAPDGQRVAAVGHDPAVRAWDGKGREVVLRGHTGYPACAAFGPDGRRLVTGGFDGLVKVWDTTSDPEALFVPATAAAVACFGVAFSPDGKAVVSAGLDRALYFWDTARGEWGPALRGHTDSVVAFAFSPDGKRLVSAGSQGTVKVWDVPTGRDAVTLQRPSGSEGPWGPGTVSAVAFSHGGRRVVWAGSGGVVKGWDVGTGKQVVSFRSPHHLPTGLFPLATVRAGAFSPDGRRFASGGANLEVKVWDTGTGKATHALRLEGDAPVLALAFTRDGERLAAALGGMGHPGEMRVWGLKEGREELTFAGHASPALGLEFSPDGKRLVATGQDHPTLKVWDAHAGVELLTLSLRNHGQWGQGPVFSPDGQTIALGCALPWEGSAGLLLWRAPPAREALVLRKHSGQVYGVAFAAASGPGEHPERPPRLVTAGGHTVRVWDWTRGEPLLGLAVEGAPDLVARDTHPSHCWDAAFSPDGRHLALARGSTKKGSVLVCEADTGRAVRAFEGLPALARSVAYAPFGRHLAAACWDRRVRVWGLETGEERKLEGHTDRVNGVAFSPDGKSLASGGHDKKVLVWDVASGAKRFTLKGHKGPVSGVAFSPQGDRLASAGGTEKAGEVFVWDVPRAGSSGAVRLRLPGHTARVLGLAFSPNGRLLATGGDDRVVRVWHADSGTKLLELRGHQREINRVAFSPDGRFVASASEDQTVRVWDVSLP
jgi:WD40 repeat protein